MNRAIADMLDPIPIPPMARVRQRFDSAHILDVPKKLREELSADWVRERLSGCRKVGITVGSRGIANLKEVVRELCGFLRTAGIVPYLIPSMGSHGAAQSQYHRCMSSYAMSTRPTADVSTRAQMPTVNTMGSMWTSLSDSGYFL